MEYTKNGVPLFDGENYALWNGRMHVYRLAKGYDIWETIKQGYDAKASPPTNEKGWKFVEYDAKSKNSIMSGLTQSVYVKVLGCEITKELWGKLQNIYEGDSKVKEAKIQIFKAYFEQLKMKEHKNIATFTSSKVLCK